MVLWAFGVNTAGGYNEKNSVQNFLYAVFASMAGFGLFCSGNMLCSCPGDSMTVYLDGAWLLNGFVDYLLLVVSGNLTASPIRRRRILLAGALGGFYGVVCLLPGWAFFGNLLWRIVVAGLMCLVAFGPGKLILRQMVVLFLLTAAFSGVVLLLTELFSAPASFVGGSVYYPVSTGALVLTAGGAYGAITWALGRMRHQGGDIVPVTVALGKRTAELTALRDTGNTLRDPITGAGVLVVDWTVMKKLLPKIEIKCISEPQILMQALGLHYPNLRPRLIPYKTIGVSHGMLVAIRPEEVKLSGKKENLLVAFSPVAVSDGGGYQALVGGTQC